MQGRARARAQGRAHDAHGRAAPPAPPLPHSFTLMHSTYVTPEAEGEEECGPQHTHRVERNGALSTSVNTRAPFRSIGQH